jgi:galactoside O-acetyltransferase
LKDYVNLSSRVSIYSSNDDYSGEYMTNPMVPEQFTNVRHADVVLKEHVIVGSGTVILPGSNLNRGVAIGALSLVNGEIPEFQIFAGVPAIFKKERSKRINEIESENFK